MIEHNTQILARGIQRENSKDSPSKGGLHKEQSALQPAADHRREIRGEYEI